LDEADDGLSIPGLTHAVNLRKGQIEKVLKLLSVVEAAPVVKRGGRWYRTANAYQLDQEHIRRLTRQRQEEAEDVQVYLETDTCLMQFLAEALDDPNASACGRCENCRGRLIIDVQPDRRTISEAARFVKQSEVLLPPRRRWETDAFPRYGWRGNIPPRLRCEEGRALAMWRDAGWGPLVEQGKESGKFSDELVEACVGMVRERWVPDPFPTWVTCIPSRRTVLLVPDFSRRLADALGLPFFPAVEKVEETERQRAMMNSWQQASNLDGVFAVDENLVSPGPVLLVDDVADSRWSLAVIGALSERGEADLFTLSF
jgi:ATP-dependent DNA helicase RecQ